MTFEPIVIDASKFPPARVQVLTDLNSIADNLSNALQVAYTAAEDVETATVLYKRAEARIAGEVASAKGEDGKPLYTNDMTRKAALDARLLHETDGLAAGVTATRQARAQADISVEVVKARLRALEAIARILGE